jgi:hypothetical protein
VAGAAVLSFVAVVGAPPAAAAVVAGGRPVGAPAPTNHATQAPRPPGSVIPPDQRGEVLPADWQRSADVAWTAQGDQSGFHLLMASQASGYAWRTVASLSEPGLETDRWIGNVCFTESGRHAVVVYQGETRLLDI